VGFVNILTTRRGTLQGCAGSNLETPIITPFVDINGLTADKTLFEIGSIADDNVVETLSG
jgi:hypothetical protein